MQRVTSSAHINCRPVPRVKLCRNHASVRLNAVSAPGFNAKSNTVVTMKSSWQKTSILTASTDAVNQYTCNVQEYLGHLDLPLEAQFSPVDTEAQPAKWSLQLPELRFVNISVRPVALCHVVRGPGKVDVTTYGASVEVSDKMKGLGLHDRYSVDAAVSIRATSDKQLHTSAALTLAVDIPPMFRMTPKPMIQVTGSAVLSNVVSVLMEDFVKTMLRDIEELSTSPAAPIKLLEGK